MAIYSTKIWSNYPKISSILSQHPGLLLIYLIKTSTYYPGPPNTGSHHLGLLPYTFKKKSEPTIWPLWVKSVIWPHASVIGYNKHVKWFSYHGNYQKPYDANISSFCTFNHQQQHPVSTLQKELRTLKYNFSLKWTNILTQTIFQEISEKYIDILLIKN